MECWSTLSVNGCMGRGGAFGGAITAYLGVSTHAIAGIVAVEARIYYSISYIMASGGSVSFPMPLMNLYDSSVGSD